MLYEGKVDKIVNFTQHASTETQQEQGVIEPDDKEYVKSILENSKKLIFEVL